MRTVLFLLSLCGCGDPPPAADPSPDPAPATETDAPPPDGGPAVDQGQQHPPLPADNPVWEWDAGGFVPDYGWYGEHSWADVRMRVAGHLSTAGRDLARLQAQQGDLAGAAETYVWLAVQLDEIAVAEGGVSQKISVLLSDAARSDAALLTALSASEPLPEVGGMRELRRRYLAAAVRTDPDPAALSSLQRELLPLIEDPRPDLAIDGFEDFDSRHELRVALFEAYLDSLDPLALTDPWGYFTADERRRQALALFVAAGSMGGGEALPDGLFGSSGPFEGAVVDVSELPPIERPAAVARGLRAAEHADRFTREGLGWLPTGDALIDVGAEPGPLAIGTLEKLGLDDPAHAAWLDSRAGELNAALVDDPEGVQPILEGMVDVLDGHGHGSRYYNIKQARNEAVRVLARTGRPDLARIVLRGAYPLHHQDWACPNRIAILEALEGRLLALAGDPGAEAMLRQSLESSQHFLDQVGQAEALGPRAPGNRPPQMGGRGPGQGGPGAGKVGKAGKAGSGRPPGKPPGTPPGSPQRQ